jgi:hypothetical protein
MRMIVAAALATVLITSAATAQSFGVATFFAAVSSQGETLLGSGIKVSSRTALGKYSITFTRPVTSCAFATTVRSSVGGHAAVTGPGTGGQRIIVATFSSSGVAANRNFDLIVFCGP